VNLPPHKVLGGIVNVFGTNIFACTQHTLSQTHASDESNLMRKVTHSLLPLDLRLLPEELTGGKIK
jgi:hypothetical protein